MMKSRATMADELSNAGAGKKTRGNAWRGAPRKKGGMEMISMPPFMCCGGA